MTITDISLDTVYTYKIKLFNSTAETFYSDPLIIKSKLNSLTIPRFIKVSNNIILKANLDVYLEEFGNFDEETFSMLICRPSFKPTVASYIWFKDGLELKPNTISSNISFSENRLIFNDLNHFTDDGEYYCGIKLSRNNQILYTNRSTIQVKRNLLLY